MTPAVNVAKKHKIAFSLHKYQHDRNHSGYGLEALEKLNLPAEKVFKTLITRLDKNELVVAIVPVTSMLDLKLLAQFCGVKKGVMADKSVVEKTTGYVIGGVSPLGQKKRLRTVIDLSAQHYKRIFVSGGRRGLEIELNPQDLAALTIGSFGTISQKS